jgi:peptidoglycan/LPS O-acetylase OafA/YrhL
MSPGDNSLATVLDRKRNGLNAIRLALALGVIAWHSFPLTGRTVEWEPARQLLELVFVDGFFAISGVLIVGNWHNNPNAACIP